MKIVHCFYTMEMGGAQVLAVDLMNYMCADHQIALVVVNNMCSDALLQKLDGRVKVYKINRKEGSRNPLPLLKLNLLLQKLAPHIIHCHEPDIGRILKAKTGKKIYTIHDVGIPTTYYHHFDTLVAISDAVQHDVVHRLNRPVEKVYNGINAALFQKRTRYQLKGEKIKLVQLSRLMHEKKGQDVLLQALHEVKNKGYNNFTLHFVGNGPSMEYLKKLSTELQLTDEVIFAGERDRDWLFQNLADYHLLVQPSRYEGFGLTILEGFAAGLPVLASNIEGPAEIIQRTPRGFLFANGNSSDCAQKLINLFKDYEEGNLAQLMEETASIAEKEYSIEACVKGYLAQYKRWVNT